MKEIILNDGNKIPIVGFGTYLATGQKGIDSVKNALACGYRMIDTAAKYDNEAEVGKGIKKSGVLREQIFVTTKIWRNNMSYGQTIKTFHESLNKLELDYVDLYLIHWPANDGNYDNWQETNAEVWHALEDLQAGGKIRSIGVSNFWQEHLEALFKTAKVLPAVNQLEFHPGYRQPEVTKFCKEHNIAVISWSPLARGRIFENEILKQIATKHHKSVPQICLRWAVQHGVIVIPKSTKLPRIEENINLFDFELSEADMKLIDALPEMGFSGELPNSWID